MSSLLCLAGDGVATTIFAAALHIGLDPGRRHRARGVLAHQAGRLRVLRGPHPEERGLGALLADAPAAGAVVLDRRGLREDVICGEMWCRRSRSSCRARAPVVQIGPAKPRSGDRPRDGPRPPRAARRLLRQRGIACGQRGWKWQPAGGESGEESRRDRLELRLARIEARHLLERAWVYGWFGARKISSAAADSTMRPRYMMTTRSERCSTTPRSWLMKKGSPRSRRSC